ncbi:MAG: spermidine/putrescine ABC transporter substrate-binding protein [Clostridiaceae bacterium]|jgi:spermidine/putrescine transport system substrate-binding protein|nr:spermidine/putrescine ABC transporter substrate-binding protein [Clostridiaceae bacterium]
MKKIFTILLCLTLCLGLIAGCASKPQTSGGTLNLFTWEGMFPSQVLKGFTAETGIAINYNNFDYDETMLAKLQAAKGGDYDLIIADDYIIETVISEGLAQKLDRSKLTNYSNINPFYQDQFFDPSNAYTVPYGAGVQTIVYDPAFVDIEINGYADLFDPSLEDNIGIIANYRVITGLALKILGESYNTEDVDTIEAAGKKLLELAPNIRVIKDDNLQDDLVSGEIAAAVMYTSQVTTAKLARPDLKVVFPSEGIGFGIMASFIPSKAPNADAAYTFLDYILRPEIAAECFEWIGYYSTNSAADSLISKEYRDFLTLPSDFSGDTEMIQVIGADAEDAHSKAWTAFKSASGK